MENFFYHRRRDAGRTGVLEIVDRDYSAAAQHIPRSLNIGPYDIVMMASVDVNESEAPRGGMLPYIRR
jgi:hypothetical protein